MSKKDLDNIEEHIEHADNHLRSAGKIAKRVGDNDGAQKISKQRDKIKKLKEDFNSKGS